jgi:hypothetical protein
MTNWLDPRLLASEVHAAIGCGFLLALALRVPQHWWLLALLVFWVVVFVKESLWDPIHELDQPFVYEGLKDLAFYAVGMAVALVIIFA